MYAVPIVTLAIVITQSDLELPGLLSPNEGEVAGPMPGEQLTLCKESC